MATLQATTTSNRPRIDPDAVADVEAIIAEYDFIGNFDTLTVAVTDADTEDSTPQLKLYGYASFDASKPIVDDDGHIYHDYGYTEEFLNRLAPHLTEQLVVETIGFEKCRFPLLAGQWIAWPDGTVMYNSFDHSPDKPTTPDSDIEAAHSATNRTESSV